MQQIKQSFKQEVDQERRFYRKPHLTPEQRAKKAAAAQVERFLGRHYYTSEPFGLVF